MITWTTMIILCSVAGEPDCGKAPVTSDRCITQDALAPVLGPLLVGRLVKLGPCLEGREA